MSSRAKKRREARGLPAPPQIRQKEVVIPFEDLQALLRFGSTMIDRHTAQAIWNTARKVDSDVSSGVLAVAAGAGTVINLALAVVSKHCGPPSKEGDPFAAFPEWATDMLKVCGVIRQKVEAAPPDAPPEPVKDDVDLARRAEAAGLVLAES